MCPGLTELDAAGCGLETLPESLFAAGALRKLLVARNALAMLPFGVEAATALEVLDVGGNGLVTLPPALGALAALAQLNVTGCPLRLARGAPPVDSGTAQLLRWLRRRSPDAIEPALCHVLEDEDGVAIVQTVNASGRLRRQGGAKMRVGGGVAEDCGNGRYLIEHATADYAVTVGGVHIDESPFGAAPAEWEDAVAAPTAADFELSGAGLSSAERGEEAELFITDARPVSSEASSFSVLLQDGERARLQPLALERVSRGVFRAAFTPTGASDVVRVAAFFEGDTSPRQHLPLGASPYEVPVYATEEASGPQDAPEPSAVVKVVLAGGDARYLAAADVGPSLRELLAAVRGTFGLSEATRLRVRYIDGDGDRVELSTDAAVAHVLSVTAPVKLVVDVQDAASASAGAGVAGLPAHGAVYRNCLRIVKPASRGSTRVVAETVDGGQPVALKFYRDRADFAREAAMADMPGANEFMMVALQRFEPVDGARGPDSLWAIAFEYAEDSLAASIASGFTARDDFEIKRTMHDVTRVLRFLHGNGLSAFAMAPAMFGRVDRGARWRLMDLSFVDNVGAQRVVDAAAVGLSTAVAEEAPPADLLQPGYCAPELAVHVLSFGGEVAVAPSMDQWCLGQLLWSLCVPAKAAYANAARASVLGSASLLAAGRDLESPPELDVSEFADEQAGRLVAKLLRVDPSRRPNIAKTTGAAFLRGGLDTAQRSALTADTSKQLQLSHITQTQVLDEVGALRQLISGLQAQQAVLMQRADTVVVPADEENAPPRAKSKPKKDAFDAIVRRNQVVSRAFKLPRK